MFPRISEFGTICICHPLSNHLVEIKKRIQKNTKMQTMQKYKNAKKYNPLSNHLVDIPGGAFGPSVHAGNKRLQLKLSG